MNTLPMYRLIAQAISARKECTRTNNPTWHDRWENLLKDIEANLLPSGSGLDVGCNIDLDSSTPEKIVILSSVHMMNDVGVYDSSQDFKVTVRPSFQGISLRIQRIGRGNYRLWSNWIDDLHEQFDYILKREVNWDENGVRFAPEVYEAQTA